MTKEEILAMEAGEALDILVAVEIMGWVKGRESSFGFYWHTGGRSLVKDWRFKPSTDILAAWQVVEKMTGEGYYFGLYTVIEDNQVKWDCFFSEVEMGELVEPLIEYGRAPEAICKAALLAKLEVKT